MKELFAPCTLGGRICATESAVRRRTIMPGTRMARFRRRKGRFTENWRKMKSG